MRKSTLEAAETRRRIVSAAAEAFRARGIEGASLAEVMSAAGLTHGGFYKHFDDKEQLVAEALAQAGRQLLGSIAEGAGKDGRPAIAESYLSAAHRDSPATGCPLAALGPELARAGDRVRAAGSEIVDALIAAMADSAPAGPGARPAAMLGVSVMVGAVILSRIAADRELSAEILQTARTHLAGAARAG